nr:recombinase XerD [Lachnospiraceae bacterium]
YEYYRRVCRKLGIKLCREYIKGTHSFRRNATTDIINLSNGNAELESKLIGHSPEVARKHYFTGIDMQNAIKVLNQRKLS